MLSRGGLPEVPCAKCGDRVVGLAWGDLCPRCRAERSRRASKLATRISLAATLLMGAVRRTHHAPGSDGSGLRGGRRRGDLHHRAAHRGPRGHGDHEMMKSLLALGVLAAPLSAQTSVTIYNDGRVLVRREVPVAVPKGSSSHKVSLGPLDPASLFPLDSGVAITRVSYDGATDEGSALRRSVGRRIVFRLPRVQGHAERGRSRGGSAAAPAARTAASPSSRPARRCIRPKWWWPIRAAALDLFERQGAEDAPPGVLHRRRDLAGELSGDDRRPYGARGGARGAGVAGPPCRKRGCPAPRRLRRAGRQGAASRRGRWSAASRRRTPWPTQVASEQRVGEFHLYTLPGKSTLLPGLTTSVALFEPAEVPYERTYEVRGLVPYWGILPQEGEESEAPVEVSYTLKRPHKTEFGDRPLPGGVARIYQPDSAGRPQLVGEASMEHTPAGRDLRLAAGHRLRPHRAAGADRLRHPPRQHRRVRRADRRHGRLPRDGAQRHRQRDHRGRDRGAGGRVVRGEELGPCGEAFHRAHPLPGKGARPAAKPR